MRDHYRLPFAMIATSVGLALSAWALEHTTAASMIALSFVGLPAFVVGALLALLEVSGPTWCPDCQSQRACQLRATTLSGRSSDSRVRIG
jgi:hypothetical protein